MPFPLPPRAYPTKEEMADYLEVYARHFALPIRLKTTVETLTSEGEQYLLTSGDRRFRASHVVVAMGALQQPKIPEFASSLDAAIRQLHSQQYRTPQQLQAGAVLIVGAGNSGAEMALDLVKRHSVWLAGPEVGHVPVGLGNPLLWWIFSQVLTVHTPLGRAAIKSSFKRSGAGASPLFRLDSGMLEEASVKRVPRVRGVQQGKPQLADGQLLDIAQYERLYRALLGSSGGPWFVRKMRAALTDSIKEHRHLPHGSNTSSLPGHTFSDEFVPDPVSAMFVESITWWLEQGRSYTAREVATRTALLAAALFKEASTWQ